MQVFVSDMGYVYVTAMKSVNGFSKSLKLFAKEVGVPEAIIADSHKCNKSKEVNYFATRLAQLSGSSRVIHSGITELNFMLVFSRKL